MNRTARLPIGVKPLFESLPEQRAVTVRENFSNERAGLFVLFAVSPCPFALIKHLEHERRQITASDTGVPVRSHLSAGPKGALPVFHRAGYDMGAVTAGGPPRPRLLL